MTPKENPGCHTGETNGRTASLANLRATYGAPYQFQDHPKTQTARARRALKPGGPGARLIAALGEHAYLFTPTVRDLDPSLSDHPDGLDDDAVVDALFRAAAENFRGPFFMVLEEGEGDASGRGHLHPHVIAPRDDGPQHIPRESQRCKWVYDPLGLYRYLNKHRPYSLEAHLSYDAALILSSTGRTPKVRRHFLGPDRLAYAAELTARAAPLPPVLECGKCRGRCLCRRPAQCTNGLTLESSPSQAAVEQHTAPAPTRADPYRAPVPEPLERPVGCTDEGTPHALSLASSRRRPHKTGTETGGTPRARGGTLRAGRTTRTRGARAFAPALFPRAGTPGTVHPGMNLTTDFWEMVTRSRNARHRAPPGADPTQARPRRERRSLFHMKQGRTPHERYG